jgi:hypothetical protein
VEAGETVTITASVRDALYLGVNSAEISALVTGPAGHESRIPLDFVVDRDGEYRGRFTAPADGLYEIKAAVTNPALAANDARTYLRAAPDDGESFDAAMRASLLKRIATETGGRFYTPATAASLANDITYLGRGVTVVQQKDLWDMPVVLVLLVAMLGAEWALRRRWGLP